MTPRTDTPRRCLVALVAGLLAAPAPLLACALPTRIELRNETAQQVVALYVDSAQEAPSTFNRLPNGLAPGAAETITLPSCIGLYALRATFADGTAQRHDGIDARRIRGLALR
ncbi:hypothetical protein GXW78_14940 [Roseomonas terrae]|jgi:hypothetical protein|uniref:Lipoprotein n=1 Tax=Neoroseomonas terrae TaxID=424799 RepID=A0ABS5EK28_9PROT|nr:hypothetical protein [Neoroseomonas terrae]MBR0650967.1 hypothetical protein [Neoroseomonas terrae]